MTTNNLKSRQPRVLVVENDLRWRQDHLTNLTRWGYRPFLAQGQGQALLQDARDRAKTYRCHVALVDMQLLDHYDSSDRSGLHLVPELSPTRSIIVSASSRENLVQKALKEKGADEFINKRERRNILKKALDSSLQRICAAKKGIHVQWLDGLSDSMIISSLFGANSGLPADQVQDLLALLFPNAKRLRLKRVRGHVSAQHVVPLKVYVDYHLFGAPQVQVVEIGKKEDIQSQRPQNRPIGRDNYVYLWDLGAKIVG